MTSTTSHRGFGFVLFTFALLLTGCAARPSAGVEPVLATPTMDRPARAWPVGSPVAGPATRPFVATVMPAPVVPAPVATPAKAETPVLTGRASYYAHKFHGRRTANGERYDMHGPTAAHRTLPFGTVVRVTNLSNDRTTTVRINDRGPFINGREIDLSLGAAKQLDMVRAGIAPVRIEIVSLGDGKRHRVRT